MGCDGADHAEGDEMTENNDIRLLFQRYAEEVGGYLPRRKRKDIQLEILSLLEDSLEDLSARQGRPADEELALEVLKSHGAPIELARAYQADDNLIRPETYQLFKPVATLAGGLLALQLLLSLGLSAGDPGVDWGRLLIDWVEGAFTTLGILFFSFALLERTTPSEWLNWPAAQLTKDWDPAGLKARLRKKAVNPRESWFEIFLLVGLIIWFGIFPQHVGGWSNTNGEWSFMPVLSESFHIYKPWVILYWLGRLGFNAALVRQAYWDNRMRLAQIGLKAFGVGLLFALLVGPAAIGINPAFTSLHNTPAELQDWVTSGGPIFTVFYLVIGINLAVHFVLLMIQVIRLLRDRASLENWELPGVN
jgi:hypothetical protein